MHLCIPRVPTREAHAAHNTRAPAGTHGAQTEDAGLWQYLVRYCLGKAGLVDQLLDCIGTFSNADTGAFVSQVRGQPRVFG